MLTEQSVPPVGEKNRIVPGTLYLVATPIGNLADLSHRAEAVLAGVDFIAAEDTRNSGRLLAGLGIRKPMVSYFEHNKRERGGQICDRLAAGESCALVTDAGTPAVSDPGEDLVRLCAARGIPVTSVPGCCAGVTALTLSGLPTGRFTFEGFLPIDNRQRAARLNELSRETRTMLFHEAPHRLCETLAANGLGKVKLSIGERLSYPDEKITTGTAEALRGGAFAPLSAVLIENDRPDAVVTHGLPDSAFLRGEGEGGVVPMTKSEVRAIALSKLRLSERAVCYDIGAGTGSVAIEMALQAKKGRIFAIERRADAVELLKKNQAAFSAENLTIVAGSAPEACDDLPAPTHAFIGGSAGNLHGILAVLLQKNPQVRIVATAVSLESVAELTACMKEFPFADTEVVSVQIARSRKAGAYQLMTGQNPVYVFTMQAGGGA